MTGCRIKPALASVDAISAAIKRFYVAGPDDQEELDLVLEEHDVITPRPAFLPEAAESGILGSAVKQIEDRFENLVRIVLDRGVVDVKGLDELM